MEKFNPPSPRSSSGGADSYKNEASPETRITAFSPDGNPTRPNNSINTLSINAIAKPQSQPFSGHTGILASNQSSADKDPFVSSATKVNPRAEQKLSPTASAFRPVSDGPLVANGSHNAAPSLQLGPSSLSLETPQDPQMFSSELGCTRYLVIRLSGISSSDFLSHEQADKSLTKLGVGLQGKRLMLIHGGLVYCRFSNIRDAVNIHNTIRGSGFGWHAEYTSQHAFYQAAKPGTPSCVYPEGQIEVQATPVGQNQYMSGFEVQKIVLGFLRCHGDVFAFKTRSSLTENRLLATVEFADAEVAASIVEKYNGNILNQGIHLSLHLYHPGLTNLLPGPSGNQTPSSTFSMQDMKNALMSASKTPQLTNPRLPQPITSETPFSGPGSGHALVPTAGSGQAALLLPQQLLPQQAMGMFHPFLYQTMSAPISAPPRYFMDQTPTRGGAATPMTPMTPLSPGHMPMMSPMFTPPATPMTMQSDYTSPRSMQGLQVYGRPDGRRQNAMRVTRSPFHNNAGNHNQVDVSRIREGIDVRTTIMLRNIPNKVDQKMLKEIVDQSSWGKYDFMYLRIDFANDCNVGYAFINFVDPLDIVDFVNARGNKRWNCFKSDKVAEISYATIQGKDCLVQKFRNSSVMLEAEHYRPKLYFTQNGPRPDLAGMEEPFPPPDNQSKMKRSCENAEHVGLFTPNAGQHFRDEQRRRRSQFDRGTRLAALEEYDYDSQTQHQGMYHPQ